MYLALFHRYVLSDMNVKDENGNNNVKIINFIYFARFNSLIIYYF